jgi:(2R)-sulfolactate sulfo-lyase subunit alpha
MPPDRPPDFLVHQEGDDVAVATRDLEPGEVEGGYLVGPTSLRVSLVEEVPLGHKFALRDLAVGEQVTEYGACVGQASAPISVGQYVHVHNVRSVRWQTSMAS